MRTVTFSKTERDVGKVGSTIASSLMDLAKNENLKIIGGFQTSDATFDCLFYKEDAQVSPSFLLRMHTLTCEQWGDSWEAKAQIEDQIQNIHLEENGILRCALSLVQPGSQNKCQLLVFEIVEGDRLYTVANWPEYLQEQLEIDLDHKNLQVLNYDQEITMALNA